MTARSHTRSRRKAVTRARIRTLRYTQRHAPVAAPEPDPWRWCPADRLFIAADPVAAIDTAQVRR